MAQSGHCRPWKTFWPITSAGMRLPSFFWASMTSLSKLCSLFRTCSILLTTLLLQVPRSTMSHTLTTVSRCMGLTWWSMRIWSLGWLRSICPPAWIPTVLLISKLRAIWSLICSQWSAWFPFTRDSSMVDGADLSAGITSTKMTTQSCLKLGWVQSTNLL